MSYIGDFASVKTAYDVPSVCLKRAEFHLKRSPFQKPKIISDMLANGFLKALIMSC